MCDDDREPIFPAARGGLLVAKVSDLDTIWLPLYNRRGKVITYALIDATDADQAAHRWHRNEGYAARGITVDGKLYVLRLHRAIMGLVPGDGLEVDHINRDRLDYRRSNLRIVTHARNSQNLTPRTGGTSRFRGVSWAALEGKWRADARVSYKNHYLGYFATEEEADAACRTFRAEHMPFSEEARA